MEKMSENEKKWQTEDDVRTMKRYQEIMKDPERQKRAMSQIKKEQLELAALLPKK